MLWYSSGKPLDGRRGPAALGARAGSGSTISSREYVDGWGNGKERCTLRHVLIHTGGFPMYGDEDLRRATSRTRRTSRASPRTAADWEPGTAAAYHPVERLEGARRDRRGRRRPTDRPVPARARSSTPLGMPDARLSASRSTSNRELGDRLVPGALDAATPCPIIDDDGALRMVPYRIDELHNQPWHIAKVEPGARTARPGARARRVLRVAARVRTAGPRAAHGRGDGRGAPPRHRRTGCSADRCPGVSASQVVVHRRHRPARLRARRHGVVARAAPTPSAGS